MRNLPKMTLFLAVALIAGGGTAGMVLWGITEGAPCAAPRGETAAAPPGDSRDWTTATVAEAGSCPRATAAAVYTRGALSTAMRDGCQKDFDLKAGKYPLGVAYGSTAYRGYTFEHGEPKDCEGMARVLREIGEVR